MALKTSGGITTAPVWIVGPGLLLTVLESLDVPFVVGGQFSLDRFFLFPTGFLSCLLFFIIGGLMEGGSPTERPACWQKFCYL